MNRVLFIFLFCVSIVSAQSKKDTLQNLDKEYLEDQFFIGVTYNLLTGNPAGIKLRGFSNTIFTGYIRDIPFNRKRNVGVGLGLGYGRNSYFNNLKIIENEDETLFSDFADTDDFSSNKLVFHTIDLPIEFRIRNSNYIENKFWRVYVGMKFSYVIHHKSQFDLGQEKQQYINFGNFEKLHYGVTLSSGIGTLNGYLYYGLTNIFDNVKFNQTALLNVKSIRFGLILYVL